MWVHPFKKHPEIKEHLLKLISNIPPTRVKEAGDTINHSDFYLPKNFEREYLEYFYHDLKDHMAMLCDLFKSRTWSIKSGWFQQYIKGDSHNYHNHGESQFAGVYYLELPNKSMTTEFLDGTSVDAKEGDIIIFPSYKYHRSKKNTSKKRKTVIAFNCSFDVWNGNKS
mgnify:FL=1